MNLPALQDALRKCQLAEATKIRSMAHAVEIASTAGKLERQAAEIRIRAERRIGELLRERRSQRATLPAGISKTQSSRWQMLARVPPKVFERALAKTPSTSAIIKLVPRRSRGPEQGGHIYTCDLMDLDCRPDLILTDPPYADLEAYSRLAKFAARHDCPCLCYCGQAHLPEVFRRMAGLKYWWTIAVRYGGRHNAIHGRRVQCCWKPILWFGRAPDRYMVDMLTGGREKGLHVWQQPESEATYLIERLTDPGALVCDPFCGSGTILAAAKAIGRAWIGCDTDAGRLAWHGVGLLRMASEVRNDAPE